MRGFHLRGDPSTRWTATSAITILPAQNGHLAPCHAHTRHETGGSGLKFSNVEEARRYAETLGPNGHQIDPLVLHFNGKPLSALTRDEIIAGVSGINVSSPD